MQGRHRWSVAAVALVASVALAASFPPAAGLLTRTDLRLPWKSPLGPLGKLHYRPTTTNVTTGPVPTYARPPHKQQHQQQQQQPQQQQQQRKPVAPKGPGATEPARGPGAVAYDRAPTARQPATNATVTPRPVGLESTTHDRAIIMAPLKRCPEGQRMGPDRNCRPNYTDPEDEAD